MGDELPKNLAGSPILECITEVPFLFGATHQNDSQRMWKMVYHQHRASSSPRESITHSISAQIRYTDQSTQRCTKEWIQMSARSAYRYDLIYNILLTTIFSEVSVNFWAFRPISLYLRCQRETNSYGSSLNSVLCRSLLFSEVLCWWRTRTGARSLSTSWKETRKRKLQKR